jgi:hypothetical protein
VSRLMRMLDRPHNRVLILLIAIFLLLGIIATPGSLGRITGLTKEQVTTASVTGASFVYDVGQYPELDRLQAEYRRLQEMRHPNAEAKFQEMWALMEKLSVMQSTTVEVGEEVP